jgi:predicted transcriptional regulator
MSDTFNLQQAAAAEQLGADLATGGLELQPVDDPGEAAEIIAQLPPAGAPVTVVRPIRLPHDVDAAVRRLAEQQGTTPSALIRRWVEAALADTTTPDPVTELRYLSAAVQRIAETLDSTRARDAA